MNFTKDDLEKWINHELSFLRYYGWREDREALTNDSDIYRDVRSIGYTKRVISLSTRCSPAIIKCDSEINQLTKIEDLYLVSELKSDNNFTPCEVFIKLFPERKMEIIDIIKSFESNLNFKIKLS
jgi:hypothetical protein